MHGYVNDLAFGYTVKDGKKDKDCSYCVKK